MANAINDLLISSVSPGDADELLAQSAVEAGTVEVTVDIGGAEVTAPLTLSTLDAATLQTAIEDLANVGAGNVAVANKSPLSNEIHLLDLGGASDGDYFEVVNFVGASTLGLFSGDEATLQARFDAVAGAGNVLVTDAGSGKFFIENIGASAGTDPTGGAVVIGADTTDGTGVTIKRTQQGGKTFGWRVTFQGDLANTPIDDFSAAGDGLKQPADTIVTDASVVDGEADVPSEVDNDVFTSAVQPVSPVNEVQHISTAGGTGTFDLSDADNLVTDTVIASAGVLTNLQDVLDAIFGSGNAVAASPGANEFTITFTGDLAGMPIGEMLVTNEVVVDVDISTDTQGVEEVAGIHQVDRCVISPAPTSGSMLYAGQALTWNTNANTLTITGGTASGTPASGLIVFTWTSYDDETPKSVDADTLTLLGEFQVGTVSLPDSPTGGTLKVTANSIDSAPFAPDADNATITTALGTIGFAVSGTPGNWTFTAGQKLANVTFAATEVDPLVKDAGIVVVQVQAGSPLAYGTNKQSLTMLTL